MTPHHNYNDDIVTLVIGYTTSFLGQMALFGVEMLKAAILGFVGASAGLLAKFLYQRWFKK